MAAFRINCTEFHKLRHTSRKFFSLWCFALLLTLVVINATKYSVAEPIELPILVALGEEVSRWPRYLGLFTVVVLDSLVVGLVHGFSEAFEALNAELAATFLSSPSSTRMKKYKNIAACWDEQRSTLNAADDYDGDTVELNSLSSAGFNSVATSTVKDGLPLPSATDRTTNSEKSPLNKPAPEGSGAYWARDQLENFRLRYVDLCEIVAQARSAFANYLIVTILDSGLHLMVVTYILLTHSMEAICIGHPKFFFVMVGLTGISLVRIYALCIVASRPKAQVAKALRLLSRISLMNGFTTEENHQHALLQEVSIVKFYEELKQGNPTLSAGGYFTVSKKMILSVIATVNTYLIILFQFSVSETGNVHDLACLYSQFNHTAAADGLDHH